MDELKNLENLTTAEIIELAYSNQDEEEYWSHIAILHQRGTICEFEAAKELCRSADPIKREIGADILGQLGWSERRFQGESVEILIGLLTDPGEDVVASAAFSLGHRNDPAAIPELVKLIHHPNDRVRFGVTTGLSCHEDSQAIEGLIELSKDDDEEVRNWATFGLGTQIETNSPEICNALLARLSEENQEIRGEALVGLARRKHPDAIKYIIKELNGQVVNVLILEAAALLESPELYPLLIKWKNVEGEDDSAYFEDELEDALKACSPDRPVHNQENSPDQTPVR